MRFYNNADAQHKSVCKAKKKAECRNTENKEIRKEENIQNGAMDFKSHCLKVDEKCIFFSLAHTARNSASQVQGERSKKNSEHILRAENSGDV